MVSVDHRDIIQLNVIIITGLLILITLGGKSQIPILTISDTTGEKFTANQWIFYTIVCFVISTMILVWISIDDGFSKRAYTVGLIISKILTCTGLFMLVSTVYYMAYPAL